MRKYVIKYPKKIKKKREQSTLLVDREDLRSVEVGFEKINKEREREKDIFLLLSIHPESLQRVGECLSMS